MEPNDLQNLIKIWKVLEMLTVSLDRLGAYEWSHGEDAAKEALHQFIKPPMFNKIASARQLMIQILQQYDPDIRDKLEDLVENEEEIGYWTGAI